MKQENLQLQGIVGNYHNDNQKLKGRLENMEKLNDYLLHKENSSKQNDQEVLENSSVMANELRFDNASVATETLQEPPIVFADSQPATFAEI
jgi:hypothetical protein